MYSILIRNGDKSWVYAVNEDGTQFRGDSAAAKTRLAELAETYPLGKLAVVHNVTLTSDFTIEDVE